MKTLRLYAATLLAIKTFTENGEPFSALDITNFIEDKLTDGEWELFSGSSQAKHSTIREYVQEIMDNELLSYDFANYEFVKEYVRNANGESFKQYSVEFEQGMEDVDCCGPACCRDNEGDQCDNRTVSNASMSNQHTVSIQNNVGRVIIENGRVEIQFS